MIRELICKLFGHQWIGFDNEVCERCHSARFHFDPPLVLWEEAPRLETEPATSGATTSVTLGVPGVAASRNSVDEVNSTTNPEMQDAPPT